MDFYLQKMNQGREKKEKNAVIVAPFALPATSKHATRSDQLSLAEINTKQPLAQFT
jgi:hypothetical protein